MKFNKSISLTLTAYFSVFLSGLSGCAATQLLGDAVLPDYQDTQTVVSDVLIAIGKPTQKIKNHEKSLVLVGNQHSYFIDPNSNNKQLFNQIFSQVDLNNVYINKNNINAKIEPSCRYQHGCGTVDISFIKEKAKLQRNEKNTVKELGFACRDKTMKGKNYLACSNNVAVGYTVISQVKNVNSLQHTFKKPVNLEVTKNSAKSTGDKGREAIFYTLSPVAIVIDVVTFPIQAAVAVASIDASDWH